LLYGIFWQRKMRNTGFVSGFEFSTRLCNCSSTTSGQPELRLDFIVSKKQSRFQDHRWLCPGASQSENVMRFSILAAALLADATLGGAAPAAQASPGPLVTGL
jgi:hypothetical protein